MACGYLRKRCSFATKWDLWDSWGLWVSRISHRRPISLIRLRSPTLDQIRVRHYAERATLLAPYINDAPASARALRSPLVRQT
jgi:hypothetical protein